MLPYRLKPSLWNTSPCPKPGQRHTHSLFCLAVNSWCNIWQTIKGHIFYIGTGLAPRLPVPWFSIIVWGRPDCFLLMGRRMQLKSYSLHVLLIALWNPWMMLLLTFYMTKDYIVLNDRKRWFTKQVIINFQVMEAWLMKAFYTMWNFLLALL